MPPSLLDSQLSTLERPAGAGASDGCGAADGGAEEREEEGLFLHVTSESGMSGEDPTLLLPPAIFPNVDDIVEMVLTKLEKDQAACPMNTTNHANC